MIWPPFLTCFSWQMGITHAFISEFDSEADRTYYMEQDPAHKAFVQSLAGIVEKAQVVDFTPGVFAGSRHTETAG